MSIRKILLPIANRPECQLAIDKAAALALALEADLCGCHLTPKPKQATRADGTRARAAKKLFEDGATHHGLKIVAKRCATGATASWMEAHGTPDQVMPLVGRASDLIVVSRPHSQHSRVAHAFMAEAVLSSGKPALVLPQKRHVRLAGHIGIAWNRSVEAARALTAAIPLLQMAEKVTFYVCEHDLKHGPTARDMTHYLAWHGIKAGYQVLKGSEATEIQLIHALQDDECGLVVMGGYSHARFRERIFGGVTEFMLYQARMPVFLMH